MDEILVNEDIKFDYVIIGAGPSGLTLAYTLSYLKYKVALIEKSSSLGGCHRVNRVDGLFAEHGPRIYLDSYVNLISLLRHMGLNFKDLFVPDVTPRDLFRLKFWEIMLCGIEYFKFLLNSDYGKHIPVSNLIKDFSPESKDFVDRLCRLTDGAGSDRYTVHQFLNLFNQNLFYNGYIPKVPNDVGLFKKWEEKIPDVTILLNKNIKDISVINGKVEKLKLNDDSCIFGKNFIFCIPPQSLIQVIKDTPIQNAFGEFSLLNKWANQSGYNTYIPIAFHWDVKIDLPKIWGFPVNEWGISFVDLSRYIDFQNPQSKTVISTCIMYTDIKSSVTGKTANESNQEELCSEVFRQLKQTLQQRGMKGELSFPTKCVPNTIIRENDKWQDNEKAFVITANGSFLNSKSPVINNLYTVGTHNGNSDYNFTTFESAVTNAINFLHDIVPESKKEFHIKHSITVDYVIKILVLLILIFILFAFIR